MNRSASPPTIDLKAIRRGSTQQQHPKIVFLHGLDSSSHTWKDVLHHDNFDVPCIAFDLRGCGKSPMGIDGINDFSQDALVEDIHFALRKHKYLQLPQDDVEATTNKAEAESSSSSNKIIIVGHSLGGRLALAYAAKYPQFVGALVIEDMDIIQRPKEQSVVHSHIPIPPDLDSVKSQPFHRQFASLPKAIDALQQKGYPQDRIDKYVREGRIHQIPANNDSESSWWCDVNPDFRTLCYYHILDSQRGVEDWETLCRMPFLFPCHVLVAKPENGGVCFQESITEMESLMNTKNNNSQSTKKRCHIHHFATANHSIHNSARDEFLSTMKKIIKEARGSIS